MTPLSMKTPPPSTLDQYPPTEALDTIIELKVGQHPNIKSFFVHKDLITFFSGFFRAAICGNFAEAASGVVNLPTEDADTVAAFISLLYFRILPVSSGETSKFWPICTLWILADRWETPIMANALIDHMRDQAVTLWIHPSNLLNLMYENALESPGLRRFATMVVVAVLSNKKLKEMQETFEWSSDVRLGILQELLSHGTDRKLVGREELAMLDLCQYHQHKEGVRCSK
ncbi:hypothetical protein LTR78_003973 [Recurvomyces mirabilis]|uniref:BTB domain-containing protein n=1 Tax=Recurvomyces mirabilis TaxID=574656 RepID=A0AAE0WQN9_9PEZI|nr:hypothetical protein LTR78_003973 [Recurvomyces mirabilis]KAK5153889.1 hypothetical protein LTS14_007109 [Recurvomyces mirabilis]